MKELYYRILTALTLPKEDDGYSTETVIVIAVLVGAAIAAAGLISDFIGAQAEKISTE